MRLCRSSAEPAGPVLRFDTSVRKGGNVGDDKMKSSMHLTPYHQTSLLELLCCGGRPACTAAHLTFTCIPQHQSPQQHRHEEGLEGWTGGCGGGWQGCCRNSAIEEGCEEGCASEEGRQEGISCRCSGSCCDWWWQEGRQGRQGWQGWQEEVVWHCSGIPPCFRCSM